MKTTKKPLTFFGKKLKVDKNMRGEGYQVFVGKNVRVCYRLYSSSGTGWEATFENASMLEYTDLRDTPEGALRVLENRLRRMRTALNKLIP